LGGIVTRFIRKLRSAGLFLALIFLGSLIAAKLEDVGTLSIDGPFGTIDGDTLAAGIERLRLEGIDAPEIDQVCRNDAGRDWACGDEARVTLERLVSASGVDCKASDRDRYERLLVRCRAGDQDINAEMVRLGMAVSSGDYRSEEETAREERAGVWVGEFDKPREWRIMHGMMDDPSMAEGLMAWLKGLFRSE
jgi:endonuclease YncB( thermonuclease family)